MKFTIELQEQKVKPHQVTALHLMVGFALIAAGGFLATVLQLMSIMPFSWRHIGKDEPINIHAILWPEYVLIVTGLVILAVAMFRNKWLRRPANNTMFRLVELSACSAVAVYAAWSEAWVLAGIFGVLSATILFAYSAEKNISGALTLRIDDAGIRLPNLGRRRNIRWTEAETVILRHGTITVNCVDNTLYQWVVKGHVENTEAIETFCTEHIEAAKPHRRRDNW